MRWASSLVFAAVLAAGCAHSRRGDYSGGLNASFVQVRAPEFLIGPMAVLLTNARGFSAQVRCETGAASGSRATVSGELLVRGHKLLFAQAADRSLPKRFRTGPITFIWDVADNHGYVLSEALQGYAPISFGVCATNLVLGEGSAVAQRSEGGRWRQEAAVVSSSDGTATLFHVWRGPDSGGLPVRITSVTNTVPLALSLSRCRLEEPSAEAFQLPNGFTKYDTAEAMVTELTIRQQNLKRRVTDTGGQSDLPGGADAHRYR